MKQAIGLLFFRVVFQQYLLSVSCSMERDNSFHKV